MNISLHTLLFLTITLPTLLNAQLLAVPGKKQEMSNWCWAATTQAVLSYYGFEYTQDHIAQLGSNRENIGSSLHFDRPQYYPFPKERFAVDKILDSLGGIESLYYEPFSYPGSATYAPGIVSLEEVRNEITQKHPFFISISWKKSSGAHMLIVTGVDNDMIYLMDPADGSISASKYDWIVDNSEYYWSRSLTTSGEVPTSSAVSSANTQFSSSTLSSALSSSVQSSSIYSSHYSSSTHSSSSTLYSSVQVSSSSSAHSSAHFSSTESSTTTASSTESLSSDINSTISSESTSGIYTGHTKFHIQVVYVKRSNPLLFIQIPTGINSIRIYDITGRILFVQSSITTQQISIPTKTLTSMVFIQFLK